MYSHSGQGQGSRGGGATARPGRRASTCALSWCTRATTPGHNFCSKEHSWECVKRGELPACLHCKTYPKNPPHEYCGYQCGRAAQTAALLSRQTVPAAPIPLFQPPTTSSATTTNGRPMRPTSDVSNATFRPRPPSMTSTADRTVQRPSPPAVEAPPSPPSPPSPPMPSPPATRPERSYFYDPCGCKITTTMDMPPTYYICPVCKKRATPSHLEVDGKLQKFAHPGTPSAAKTTPSVLSLATAQAVPSAVANSSPRTTSETPTPANQDDQATYPDPFRRLSQSRVLPPPPPPPLLLNTTANMSDGHQSLKAPGKTEDSVPPYSELEGLNFSYPPTYTSPTKSRPSKVHDTKIGSDKAGSSSSSDSVVESPFRTESPEASLKNNENDSMTASSYSRGESQEDWEVVGSRQQDGPILEFLDIEDDLDGDYESLDANPLLPDFHPAAHIGPQNRTSTSGVRNGWLPSIITGRGSSSIETAGGNTLTIPGSFPGAAPIITPPTLPSPLLPSAGSRGSEQSFEELEPLTESELLALRDQSYEAVMRGTMRQPAVSSNAPRSPREGSPPKTVIELKEEDSRSPYFELTNAAPSTIIWEGKIYRTAWHLFYARLFLPDRPQLAEHVRNCGSNPEQEAARFSPEFRVDWKEAAGSLMDEVLFLKFKQDPIPRISLLSTKDAGIVALSTSDNWWGFDKSKGEGQNELGKALVRLRNQMREAH